MRRRQPQSAANEKFDAEITTARVTAETAVASSIDMIEIRNRCSDDSEFRTRQIPVEHRYRYMVAKNGARAKKSG